MKTETFPLGFFILRSCGGKTLLTNFQMEIFSFNSLSILMKASLSLVKVNRRSHATLSHHHNWNPEKGRFVLALNCWFMHVPKVFPSLKETWNKHCLWVANLPVTLKPNLKPDYWPGKSNGSKGNHPGRTRRAERGKHEGNLPRAPVYSLGDQYLFSWTLFYRCSASA